MKPQKGRKKPAKSKLPGNELFVPGLYRLERVNDNEANALVLDKKNRRLPRINAKRVRDMFAHVTTVTEADWTQPHVNEIWSHLSARMKRYFIGLLFVGCSAFAINQSAKAVESVHSAIQHIQHTDP